jgi:hypothetical protein
VPLVGHVRARVGMHQYNEGFKTERTAQGSSAAIPRGPCLLGSRAGASPSCNKSWCPEASRRRHRCPRALAGGVSEGGGVRTSQA